MEDETPRRVETPAEQFDASRDPTRRLIGFAVGFLLVFGVEALVIVGAEVLSKQRLRPVSPGWIIPPLLAGVAGWMLVRKGDLAGIVGVVRAWLRRDR